MLLYIQISRDESKYIIQDCGAKIIFVGSNEIYEKIKGLDQEVDCLQEIYSFDQIENVTNWQDIIDKGTKNPNSEKLKTIQKTIQNNDLFTLIYTSGTTGNPKGVMLSHSNVISQITTLRDQLPIGVDDRAISFLPLCHVFERMIEYFYMFKGVSIYYAQSLETLGDDLKKIQPTIMPTVPRLLEKVYDKILAKGAEQKGLKKILFFWAVNLGLKLNTIKPMDYGMNYNYQ